RYVVEHIEEVKANCANRNVKCDLDRVVQLEADRKRLTQETQQIQQRQNEVSKLIPMEKDNAKKQELIQEGKRLREQVTGLEKQLKEAEAERDKVLKTIPNLSHPDAPVSADPTGNKVISKWGEPRKFDFKTKDHVTIAEDLGLVDFRAGA